MTVAAATFLALILSGCVTDNLKPAAGAVTFERTPLVVGTRLTYRRTSKGQVRTSTTEILGTGTFRGREIIRFSSGSTTDETYWDRDCRCQHARVDANGRPKSILTPHHGKYNWPLFVGKSWTAAYAYDDIAGSNRWDRIAPSMRVAAQETITVPAGTFETLRIESGPGDGVGYEETRWYAPEVGVAVKVIYQRTAAHFRGPGGRRETVLVAHELPKDPDAEVIR